MITTDDATPIFPSCPTFGFTSQPEYLVKIIEREGGFERRDRKWEQPLHTYEGVPLGNRPQKDIEALLYFWHAIGGTSTIFRFKDWADYKSCILDDEPDPTDQPFAVLGGGHYQLVKVYTFGPFSLTRTLYKPKGDTIRVANEVGAEQDGSKWTLDESTGILTPNGGFTGTPTAWGGEFFVRARFDGAFKVELENHKIQTLTCTIVERRPEA